MLNAGEDWVIVDLRDHVFIVDQHAIWNRIGRVEGVNEVDVVRVVLIDRDETGLLGAELVLALHCQDAKELLLKAVLDQHIDAMIVGLHGKQFIVALLIYRIDNKFLLSVGNEEIPHLSAALVVEDIVVAVDLHQAAQLLGLRSSLNEFCRLIALHFFTHLVRVVREVGEVESVLGVDDEGQPALGALLIVVNVAFMNISLLHLGAIGKHIKHNGSKPLDFWLDDHLLTITALNDWNIIEEFLFRLGIVDGLDFSCSQWGGLVIDSETDLFLHVDLINEEVG